MTSMRVEQAVYGEVQGRGHGLRTASTDAPIVSELKLKLDLPDSAPPGVAWSPFVRGFPVGEHYVLARTILDTAASRSGMVQSHALIVALDEICALADLTELFEHLISSLRELPSTVQTLELNPSTRPYEACSELTGAANALAERSSGTVVRLGVEGFEFLVIGLWRTFWPALRRNFSFRLSFGPNDLVETPRPTIVCTPEQLQVRWTGHRILKPDDLVPATEAAAVISGKRDANSILGLAEQLGVEIVAIKDLPRLERAHHLMAPGGRFDDFLAATRLIGGLSSDPMLGGPVKSETVRRLADAIPQVTYQQLATMRNLDLSAFKDAQTVWLAVGQRVSSLEFAPPDDLTVSELLDTATDERAARSEWRDAVAAGWAAASHKGKAVLNTVWRMAERSTQAFEAAVSLLPADSSLETRLAEATPVKLKTVAPEELLRVVLNKQWLTVHGAVLSATRVPLEAARSQLKADRGTGSDAGLRLALRHASASQLLECAKVLKDPRLLAFCVDAAIAEPKLLTGITAQDLTEQAIWGGALKKSASLWSAPSDATAARDTVLLQLTQLEQVDDALVDALSKTPLADLTDFPGRSRIWEHLPGSCRDAYLQATAEGWIRTAAGSALATTPEHALERAILKHLASRSAFSGATFTVEAGLNIIGAVPSFPEDRFLAWIHSALSVQRQLTLVAAERLGVLMASRRWERAAKELADRYGKSRLDLLPALRKCAGLLGFVKCWTLGITRPSAAEKWGALEEEACELYQDGPDTNELWSRAGGKNSVLPGKTSNGSARWHTALMLIRQGGKPTAYELLGVMAIDFPGNETIRLYANDSDIVGWRT